MDQAALPENRTLPLQSLPVKFSEYAVKSQLHGCLACFIPDVSK